MIDKLHQKTQLQTNRAKWLGAIAGMLACYPTAALAQIAGDGTLGTQVNGSAIAPCTGTCTITNGATRGSNLFHSFRQFSLPNGDLAGFVTTPTIQNVIVRVTGVGQPFISNINGTIATSNPANFFLLNPNGIVFGPNATLNIGGSFLATTANRIKFADGTELRTDDPTPLLTISVPTGLQFGTAPGAIRSQLQVGAGFNSSFTDFALVGGDVTLDNATIQAPGQRVELVGVGDNGSVGLQLNDDRLSLNLAAGTLRRDIRLTNDSFISVQTSGSGGEVVVAGRDIVFDRSTILAGILPGIDNAATNQAGDITIKAVASLQLTQGSFIANLVQSNAIGNGGNLTITANSLTARDSQLATSIFGKGRAGDVMIQARDKIVFNSSSAFSRIEQTGIGQGGNILITAGSLDVSSLSQLSASTLGRGDAGDVVIQARDKVSINDSDVLSRVGRTGRGNGGNVNIATNTLEVISGAGLITNTLGIGDAGNIVIQARDHVLFNGVSADGNFPSGAFSEVLLPRAQGNGGSVQIFTNVLEVANGAKLLVSTYGIGDAGNIVIQARDRVLFNGAITTDKGISPAGAISNNESKSARRGGNIDITTGSLVISNRAVLNAVTLGTGNAGSIVITANRAEVTEGAVSVSTTSSGRANDIILNLQDSLTLTGEGSGLLANTFPGSTGNGGSIFISVRTVAINNGATIAVDSQGSGQGGYVNIRAGQLELHDRGSITAETFSDQGGNIFLNLQDLLLLRNNSKISTTAGTAQAGGNGGNIAIGVPFIIGVLAENNDITANAFTGRGGNITISTNAIYGLQFQPQLTPFSDITASSRFGINGTVAINTLNVDPSRGLVALPVNLTDPSQQISQGCTPGGKTTASSFVATGRGGIPLNPEEPLESQAVIAKWVPLPEEVEASNMQEQQSSRIQTTFQKAQSSTRFTALSPIVEAKSLMMGTDGAVELVANLPTDNPVEFGIASACRSTQEK